MNLMRAILLQPRRRFGRPSCVALAWAGWLAWAALPAAASSITNVTVVNVTPASFSVFWRAANSTPSIAVFADAGGLTNLSGQLGIETFPLHTGNPDLAAGYERRLGRNALQQKTRGFGLVQMRVNGCRPSTTYYFRLTSTPTAGSPEVYPESGPLPVVTTAAENTFVVNHQQLVIEVPGLDIEGRIALLTHTNSPHPLAAVVGDGVGTNQVFFDVNDLFDSDNSGNFSRLGAQEFAVNVLGPNQSELAALFTLNFSTNFTGVQATAAAVGNEFLAVYVGSTIVLTGQTGGVTITGNSSVGLGNIDLTLDIPPGHLTNFALSALAPEFNPGASTVTSQGGSSWLLHFAAQAGQSFSGANPLAQLTFTAAAGQPSAFVPLQIAGLAATKPDTSTVSQLVAQSGRVVVVGRDPLLEALRSPDESRTLTLYGRPTASYAIEYANALSSSNPWTFWMRLPMTDLSATLQPTQPIAPSVFYRAYEFTADPPILEALLQSNRTGSVLLYGVPGRNYRLEQAASMGPSPAWASGPQLSLTNSFSIVRGLSVTTNVFFRAHQE